MFFFFAKVVYKNKLHQNYPTSLSTGNKPSQWSLSSSPLNEDTFISFTTSTVMVGG
jgi:hypothetical protein